MTFKKGLALSANRNLLNYLATSYENKGNSTCLYQKACPVVSLTEKHTHTDTFRFKILQFKDMTFTCINMDYVLQLSIILSEVKKRSVKNKVVKRLKIPRISSTQSGIYMLFGKIPPCMHVQIQQIDFYSPLNPPIY